MYIFGSSLLTVLSIKKKVKFQTDATLKHGL